MAKKAKRVWTVAPGRTLCLDGKPVVSLAIVTDSATGLRAVYPEDADELARTIATALNATGAAYFNATGKEI